MDFFKKEECVSYQPADFPGNAHPERMDIQLWEVGFAREQPHWKLRPFVEDPYYRCYYLTAGRGTLQLLDGSFRMETGGLYLIPPNLLFKYALDEAPPEHYWIHFSSDLLDGLSPFQCLRHVQGDAELTGELETLLRLASASPSPGNSLDMDILARRVIHRFFRQAAESEEEKIHPGDIADSIDYIKRNYRHDISIPDLAARISMDSNSFSREFRRATGVTPKHYLVQTRINRARILLLSTGLSTRDVAREVGYSDEYYFYRIFRKKVNMTPTDYRKLNNALR